MVVGAVVGVVALVAGCLLAVQALSGAGTPSLETIVFVVDVSASESTPAGRAEQRERAAALGALAIDKRVPFIVMVVGGSAADTRVAARIDAGELRCDGDDDCASVNATARAALVEQLEVTLSLDAIPVPVEPSSPIGEAHADAARLASRAAEGGRAVVIWDSDLEQNSEIVSLVGVERLSEASARSKAQQVLAESPVDMTGIENIYLGVGDAAGTRTLHREALWSFTESLCELAGSPSCQQAIDIDEVLDLIS